MIFTSIDRTAGARLRKVNTRRDVSLFSLRLVYIFRLRSGDFGRIVHETTRPLKCRIIYSSIELKLKSLIRDQPR